MPLNRAVTVVILALAAVAAVLAVISLRIGPTVEGVATAQVAGATSVNSQVVVSFSRSMDKSSVIRALRVSPRIAGDTAWVGNDLIFAPRRPFRYATTYTLSISAKARDSGGMTLNRTYQSTFVTQFAQLLYIGSTGSDKGRLVLLSLNGSRQTFGPQDTNVKAYDVSPDATTVVLERADVPNGPGRSLWALSLPSGHLTRLMHRSDWDLASPRISPDGRTVAFLARNVLLCSKESGCFRSQISPVLFFLALSNDRISRFAITPRAINTISFSPSGDVAYTDLTTASPLLVTHLNGRLVTQLPGRGQGMQFVQFSPDGSAALLTGQLNSFNVHVYIYRGGSYLDVSPGVYDTGTPAFSPNGSSVAYAAYRATAGTEPIYGINVYRLKEHRTISFPVPAGTSEWAPQWSPDGRLVAFLRTPPHEAMYLGSGQICVSAANGQNQRLLGVVGHNVRWLP